MDEKLQFRGWGHTDIGNVRQVNQDSFFADPATGVFAVADGVGGRENGEVASQAFVELLGEKAETLAEFAAASDATEDLVHRERVLDLLSGQIEQANSEIFRIGEGEMATTAVVLVVSGEAGFVAHVGDSRVYLLRGGRVMRLTNDHTFAEQIRQRERSRGTIDEADVEGFEHILTRSVGTRPKVAVDTIFLDLHPGDRFVLCSDGVSGELSEAEMREIVETHPRAEGPVALVDAAKQKGSTDNLTAIVAEVGAAAPDYSFEDTRPLDTMRKVSFLEQIALFEGLEPQELLRILRIINKVEFEPGTQILKRGAELDSLYMIVEGVVSLSVDGTEVTQLHPGEHFGELALYGRDRRSADVIAVDHVSVLAIQAQRFRNLVEDEEPEMGNKLLQNLLAHASERIRSTTEKLLAENEPDSDSE